MVIQSMSWLFNGAGVNKTTIAAVLAIIGGFGLIFTGDWQAGMLMIIPALQQLFIRWATGISKHRTTLASIGGVFTGIYMASQGNTGEGLALLMASVTALFQRQHNTKTQ